MHLGEASHCSGPLVLSIVGSWRSSVNASRHTETLGPALTPTHLFFLQLQTTLKGYQVP